MYVPMCQSLTQIVLTPIATLYDNGFSGRVQNSSRAFNYPCRAARVLALALTREIVETRQLAESTSQVKAAPQRCGTMLQQA